jgi:hypothetical protein
MSADTTTTSPTPVPDATPGTPARRRPSTAGYWLGGLIAVLAILGSLAWGATVFLDWQTHVEDFPRITPPGTAAVSVTEAGTHFLYLEHDRSTTVPTGSALPAVSVTAPSGADVPLATYSGELRYDVPDATNRVGDAVLTFQAEEPGTYRVTVGDADQGTVIAVGDDLVRGWGLQVVMVVALLLAGILIGLVSVIVTAVRRAGSVRHPTDA